jgi:hypothetical protein
MFIVIFFLNFILFLFLYYICKWPSGVETAHYKNCYYYYYYCCYYYFLDCCQAHEYMSWITVSSTSY